MDPRSRYFDPYNPDREPMPPDDPAAHVFMHYVDGMQGYRRWHAYGNSPTFRTPAGAIAWRCMPPRRPTARSSSISKMRWPWPISTRPTLRSQARTLYLSAIDVSTERWRFVTQFYGGIGPNFTEDGQSRQRHGQCHQQLTRQHESHARGAGRVGNRAINTSPAAEPVGAWQFQKHLATGGEVLVGFANSFVWQFAGPDTNSNMSILNFNLVQPLLRAGSRAVVLEQLTIAERQLLTTSAP